MLRITLITLCCLSGALVASGQESTDDLRGPRFEQYDRNGLITLAKQYYAEAASLRAQLSDVRQSTGLDHELRELRDEVARLRADNEALLTALRREGPLVRQAGPDSRAEARFVDRGAFVEDRRTGLLWQKNGSESGKMNFFEAQEYAAKLELGGLSDWRVPTRNELSMIFPAVQKPFVRTRYKSSGIGDSYWTSERDHRLDDYAWLHHWYQDGGTNNAYASRNFVFVRCVHDPVQSTDEVKGATPDSGDDDSE